MLISDLTLGFTAAHHHHPFLTMTMMGITSNLSIEEQ
jgi:hypothetical protein